MAYIPKNKIQTNLYTSGGEFVYLDSSLDYVGPYYKLYNGTYFTGETPNISNKKEIIPISATIDNEVSPVNPAPSYNPILPTTQDYQVGEFVRYFSVKRNQPIYTEIDKTTYGKFKSRDSQVSWKLYKVFSLIWKLTGDVNQVAQVNKNITELTETQEQIFGLGLYLKENWIQYYKKS
jgi:hypothetical protein